ncbi:MAG: twin-arginine translocation signal domain-containing protein, partial [Cyclobacteriaceae bacterium]|nr:twin-arginine translocation signal domain-containing protein [Cyclobacteriaceae bacterium HetDA_MAG_MS6]
MDRRTFIKKTGITSGALALGPRAIESNATPQARRSDKFLNAYYFRAHMYTMVPRHVREDMKWMADIGTDAVTIAILEQDLFAAIENIEIVCNEAAKVGMQVHAVPSRWGGLVAGAPKVPSIFSTQNPDSWVLNKDGSVHHSYVSGVISSVHYQEVYDFVCESLDKLFNTWDIAGIVWDEPKNYIEDYSPQAIKSLGPNAPFSAHIQATVDFHGKL